MTSRYNLTARQLFGFLGPGVLWIVAVLLLFGNDPLAWLQTASAQEFLALFATGLLVGLLVQDLSFKICNLLSAKLHSGSPDDYFPAPIRL